MKYGKKFKIRKIEKFIEKTSVDSWMANSIKTDIAKDISWRKSKGICPSKNLYTHIGYKEDTNHYWVHNNTLYRNSRGVVEYYTHLMTGHPSIDWARKGPTRIWTVVHM